MIPRVKILATDLSTDILSSARKGEYSEDIAGQLETSRRSKFMTKVDGDRVSYRINSPLRRMIHFAQLNLVGKWPMKGPFDVIFCRNVMIYFDKLTQERLVNRFWNLLTPGGYLLIGHSEGLAGTKHKFKYVQPAVWIK